MNFKVRYNLWRERRKLAPEAKFKAVLWKNLSASWDAEYSAGYSWYQTPVFKWAVVGVAGIVVAASLGTGAYAYSSPEVTEGTALYPLKQSLEKVEELTKTTPEAKAKFLLKKIQRREAEKVVMVSRQQKIERVDEQINNIEEKLGETEKILEQTEVKDQSLKPRVRERLQKRLEQRKENLEKREDNLENKKDKLDSLNNNSTSSVLAPDSRRGAGRNGIGGDANNDN